jgi:hypothetical protein
LTYPAGETTLTARGRLNGSATDQSRRGEMGKGKKGKEQAVTGEPSGANRPPLIQKEVRESEGRGKDGKRLDATQRTVERVLDRTL